MDNMNLIYTIEKQSSGFKYTAVCDEEGFDFYTCNINNHTVSISCAHMSYISQTHIWIGGNSGRNSYAFNPYEILDIFEKLSKTINKNIRVVYRMRNYDFYGKSEALPDANSNFNSSIPSSSNYKNETLLCNKYGSNKTDIISKGEDNMKGIEARVEIETVRVDASDMNNPKLSYETLFFNNIESYNEDGAVAAVDGRKIENIRFLKIDQDVIWNKDAPKIIKTDLRKEHLENAMNYFKKKMEIDMSLTDSSPEELAMLASLQTI